MEDSKKYNFVSFFNELKESNIKFKGDTERINEGGIQNIKLKNGQIVQVYSAQLMYLFMADEFKNEGFIDEYVKGYDAGKLSFIEEFNNDMKGLWGNNTLGYTEKLRHAYFNEAVNYPQGYKLEASSFPLHTYIDDFYKIGFASGIVNEIDLMAEKNPTLFYDYEDEKKDYKEEMPFLTGLKFATGEAQELHKQLLIKDKFSFNKVALALGFTEKERPYFSATINNNKEGKNLYKSDKLIVKIYDYCIENKIDMCEEFFNNYRKIESK
jgi:hypothetical protein